MKPEGLSRETEINYIYLYGEVTFMELASYFAIGATIVSAVVLLLQIISLTKIAGLKKIIAGLSEVKTPVHIPHERQERKGGEFRRPEKRNFPEPRVRQERAAIEPDVALPAADPVEKSLRDINMKLKHAERDQESARKRIQDPMSRGEHHRGGGGRNDRDRRGHRGDRDRDQDRDRDNSRGNRRDNWQDRNREGGSQRQSGNEAGETAAPREPIVSSLPPREPIAPSMPPRETFTPSPEAGVPDMAIGSDIASEENLQHGRKIIVRRRQLKEDGSQAAEGTAQGSLPEVGRVPGAAEQAAPEAQPMDEGAAHEEIHFGRKRH